MKNKYSDQELAKWIDLQMEFFALTSDPNITQNGYVKV